MMLPVVLMGLTRASTAAKFVVAASVLWLAATPGIAAGQVAVVQGTVRDEDGRPAPRARVAATRDGGAWTDSAGTFSFSIPVRNANRGEVLILSARRDSAEAGPCRIGVVAGDTLDVALVLGPPAPARDRAREGYEAYMSRLPLCTRFGRLRRTRPAQIDTVAAQLAFDRVARAAGFPPLSGIQRSPGYRELRISSGGGMLYEPMTMLRIVDDGGRVSGGEYIWWDVRAREHWDTPQFRQQERRGFSGCVRLLRMSGSVLCERRAAAEYDWSALLAELDHLEVWTIPSQSALGVYHRAPTDQLSVLVELVDGMHYGAFEYYAPGWEPRAARVMEMLRAIADATRRTHPDR